jgi:hypothetical protein
LEQKWKAILRDAHDNESEAQTIESAVYDLKAVNPNRVTETDRRTPAELLETIATQGREADAALSRLCSLIAITSPNSQPSEQAKPNHRRISTSQCPIAKSVETSEAHAK